MYFRFALALLLVVGISLLGIAIEKDNLRLRQQITRQHYRMDVLSERLAGARSETERLGAPSRLVESLESGRIALERASQSDQTALSPAPPRR